MDFDSQRFCERVAAKYHKPLDANELEQLRRVLSHEMMVRAIGTVLNNLMDAGLGLLTADFTTAEGISNAQKLQGAINAYPRFVEGLAALAQGE